MLKQLLKDRLDNIYRIETSFQQNTYELQNCIEVLGLEVASLEIENEQIVIGEITSKRILFKSVLCGQTIITLTDGKHEATINLSVHPTGEIVAEIKPYIGKAEIVLVYYRKILAETMIAIDLRGALKHYLVAYHFMNNEDTITEVHYQSMHPNVLNDSSAGNFTLGYHPDGRSVTYAEEYALANRLATLKFSKIVIQQREKIRIITLKKLLTFVITNHVFVCCENVNERLYYERNGGQTSRKLIVV